MTADGRMVQLSMRGFRETQKFDRWFVGVFVPGMGYGVKNCRPELVEPENYNAVMQGLYDHLSRISGYYRAWFGSEALDFFLSLTPEELTSVDPPDMIYATAMFSPPSNVTVVDFALGYQKVVKVIGRP